MSQPPGPWVPDGHQDTEWLTTLTCNASQPSGSVTKWPPRVTLTAPCGKAPVSHYTKQKGNVQISEHGQPCKQEILCLGYHSSTLLSGQQTQLLTSDPEVSAIPVTGSSSHYLPKRSHVSRLCSPDKIPEFGLAAT